jgi:RHS repeat-associated protein
VPFAVLRDAIPPTATITVPARSGSPTFSVEWSGSDGAGSGAATYDLEVSEDGGVSWTRLLTNDPQTSYQYTGQPAHTYAFRVRATDNVSNTGAWAEASTVVVQITKYYHFGGQRVAMRQEGVVYYIHTDHLGSTSLTTDAGGAVVAEQRYLPYGEVRWSEGTLPTDFTFTGQRAEGFGLLDYHARFYDPVLGRFVSADTIVPNPGNPQALNRYAYVNNNPLRYTDPSGHHTFEDDPRKPYFPPLLPASPPSSSQLPASPYPPTGNSLVHPHTESSELRSQPQEDSFLSGWTLVGFRVEASAQYWFIGGDFNVDIVWDLRSREAKVLASLGGQGGFGLGASANVGPVFAKGLTDLDDYSLIQSHIGGTVSDDVVLGSLSSEFGGLAALLGFELDYGWADEEINGQRPQSFFLGVAGFGEEGTGWAQMGRQIFEIELLQATTVSQY